MALSGRETGWPAPSSSRFRSSPTAQSSRAGLRVQRSEDLV